MAKNPQQYAKELELLSANALDVFRFVDEDITNDDLRAFAEAMKGNNTVRTVQFSANKIDADGMGIICEALLGNRSVESLYMSNSAFGDEGAISLAKLLRHNHNLTYVTAGHSGIGDEGVMALASAMEVNRTLNSLSIHGNPYGTIGHQALEESILKSLHRNLTLVSNEVTPRLQAYLRGNEEAVKELRDKMEEGFDGLSAGERHDIIARAPAIARHLEPESDLTMPRLLASFHEYLQGELPYVQAFTRPQMLVEKGEGGRAPLDNPLIWKNFPEICASLKQAGSPLTLAHLAEVNSEGEPYLQAAFRHAPVSRLVRGLNESGIRVQAPMLLEKGKPSAILQTLIERGETAALFMEENWKGARAADKALVQGVIPAAELSIRFPWRERGFANDELVGTRGVAR